MQLEVRNERILNSESTLSAPDQTSRHGCPRLKHAGAPAPHLSSGRRVLPCGLAARVDELAQNLDSRQVSRRSGAAPPWHACMRTLLFVDDLLIACRSNTGATNHRFYRVTLEPAGPHRCAPYGVVVSLCISLCTVSQVPLIYH